MRDVNRLDSIYNNILTYHKNFPDIRCMQLMIDFLIWHQNEYGYDGFYVEDNMFVLRFKKFMKDVFNFS